MEFLTKAVEFLKLSTKHLLIIFFITGLALFLPTEFTDFIKLTAVIEDYRSWIGAVFLVSGVIALINIIQKFFTGLSQAKKRKGLIKFRNQKLHRLTPQEKLILTRYFLNHTTSQVLPMNDGVVNELETYKIISRSASISQGGVYFSYNIQPWASEYLKNIRIY